MGFGKENFLEQPYAPLKQELPFSCEREDDASSSKPQQKGHFLVFSICRKQTPFVRDAFCSWNGEERLFTPRAKGATLLPPKNDRGGSPGAYGCSRKFSLPNPTFTLTSLKELIRHQ
jgi:hypothetical protein